MGTNGSAGQGPERRPHRFTAAASIQTSIHLRERLMLIPGNGSVRIARWLPLSGVHRLSLEDSGSSCR